MSNARNDADRRLEALAARAGVSKAEFYNAFDHVNARTNASAVDQTADPSAVFRQTLHRLCDPMGPVDRAALAGRLFGRWHTVGVRMAAEFHTTDF